MPGSVADTAAIPLGRTQGRALQTPNNVASEYLGEEKEAFELDKFSVLTWRVGGAVCGPSFHRWLVLLRLWLAHKRSEAWMARACKQPKDSQNQTSVNQTAGQPQQLSLSQLPYFSGNITDYLGSCHLFGFLESLVSAQRSAKIRIRRRTRPLRILGVDARPQP